MSQSWTTVADIAAKIRRRYDDGSLLREYTRGTELEPIEISLRGPRPSEVGDDLATARAWVGALDAGRQSDRRYSLRWQAIGGRSIGRNQLPVRAVVSSYTQAWTLLGVAGDVHRLEQAMAVAADHPDAQRWIIDNPHRALAVADDMPGLVAAATWLKDFAAGHYLREISAPGVDTKFAERHRTILAGILAVSATPSRFLGELGLRSKPELVRFRPARSLGLTPVLTELAVRAEELAAMPLAPASALVIENEITYLSVSVPDDGVVLWGRGSRSTESGGSHGCWAFPSPTGEISTPTASRSSTGSVPGCLRRGRCSWIDRPSWSTVTAGAWRNVRPRRH